MKLYSKRIYTENGCIEGVLEIDNSLIKNIYENYNNADYDLSGYMILPGLIDIHTHGYKSFKSQSTCLDNYMNLSLAMASQGVTGFLVTAGEHNNRELEELRTISKAIEKDVPGAEILGIHMEGPFLNPKMKGAFMDEQLLGLNLDTMKTYIEASNNTIRYVTFAPELDEDGSFIKYLKSHNILVGGVHTKATYQQYKRMIDYGLNSSAHTGNGMSQIDRRGVNALGASLLEDSLYCEMICDMIHLSEEMIRIFLRTKPFDRLLMISDSGQLAGLPVGKYRIHNQNRNILPDGRIILDDGGIAGSSKSLLWDISCLKERMGIPLEDLVKLASLNQATFLGMNARKGSLATGKDADFIVVDSKFQVIATFVKGRCVYQINKTVIDYDFNQIERLD